LAGTDLHFTGKIIEVRDATEEELAPSMGCGCGSGGCGDGEEEGSCCSSESSEGGSCESGCGC
jgi:FKBP-type peptidyl-prolyl cis-trans isomerase SlyD